MTALERLKNLSWIKTYDNYDDPELIERNLQRNRETAEFNKKHAEWIKSKPQAMIDEYNDWLKEINEVREFVEADIPTYEEYIEFMYGGSCFEPVLPEALIKARQIIFENEEDKGCRVVIDCYWKSLKIQSPRGVHFGDNPPNEVHLTFTETKAFMDYIEEIGEEV